MTHRNIAKMTTLAQLAALGASALWVGCDATDPAPVSTGPMELLLQPAGPPDLSPGLSADLTTDRSASPLAEDADLAHAVNFERATISRSWPAGEHVATDTTPHVAQSRHYRLQASGQELAAGVELSFTAPHALVQVALRPDSQAAAHTLADDDITLVAADGRSYPGHQAMDAIVSAEDMQESELPFARGTTFLRVRPEIAGGTYSLRVAGLEQYKDQVVITVLEAESAYTLTASSHANAYLQGQELLVDASWARPAGAATTGQARLDTRSVQGSIRSPRGAPIPIALEATADGGFRGRMTLEHADIRPGELLEVAIEAVAEDQQGLTVRRSVVTAFAYARTTAMLSGAVSVDANDPGAEVRMSFATRIGSSGRYALTGVLFGTASDGAMRPVAVAQSAAFLEPGSRELTLAFERALIEQAGVSAPYELRDLRLLDQTRMGLLHRQADALALPRL